MKLLAMAVVADGKKGVCPPTAAETCQTCFASLLLSLSFFLSLVSRLYWRAPVTTIRGHLKILLLAAATHPMQIVDISSKAMLYIPTSLIC